MLDYVQHGGKSRGSFLIAEDGGSLNASGLKFSLEKGALSEFVQNARWENGKAVCSWRSVRCIPEADDWFEKVWNDYRGGAAIRINNGQTIFDKCGGYAGVCVANRSKYI